MAETNRSKAPMAREIIALIKREPDRLSHPMLRTNHPIQHGDNRTSATEPSNNIPDHFIFYAAAEDDNRQSDDSNPQGGLAAFRRLSRLSFIRDVLHGPFPFDFLTPPSRLMAGKWSKLGSLALRTRTTHRMQRPVKPRPFFKGRIPLGATRRSRHAIISPAPDARRSRAALSAARISCHWPRPASRARRANSCGRSCRWRRARRAAICRDCANRAA